MDNLPGVLNQQETNRLIFAEFKTLRLQNIALNELLLTHIAGQAERDANHKKELMRAEELAEARAAAQIAELKLHRKTLHAEILNRKVNKNTNNHTDNNTGWKKVAEGLVEFRSNNHKSNAAHVKRIFAENAAFLTPILAICPNSKIILSHVLTNAITLKNIRARVSPGSEASRLKHLTENEASILGKNFRKHLLANKQFSVAVDAWRLANPILQPLFDHSPIFGSIMTAVAKQLLASSNMGLVKRVTLGALLSIMDMITDAGVIISYKASGNKVGANSLIAMIGSSLAAQILSTYVQNHNKSKRVILREFAFVVTFLKPGVDAYRVATGHEDEEAVMSPLMEVSERSERALMKT